MHLQNTVMEINGLKAIINTPEALESTFILSCECGCVQKIKERAKNPTCPECKSKKVQVTEEIHGLPPHDPQPTYIVDEYPACPQEWMHGSNKAGSFFVPVETGRGLWFDFTQNAGHRHQIALVISVQGINPITGHPTNHKEWLGLQQIKNKCPKHDVELKQNRYCEKCGYKLPAQNYIATTTGKSLWLDGFRNEKGQVRQYIITEEVMRGVASQIIGDDRVWAIGFAFYLSKEEKPQSPPLRYGMSCVSLGNDYCLISNAIEGMKCQEIGAGAQIDQEIGVDPKDIDFWDPEPAALIYVNYVQPEVARRIMEVGKREDKKDGFLSGLEVGN